MLRLSILLIFSLILLNSIRAESANENCLRKVDTISVQISSTSNDSVKINGVIIDNNANSPSEGWFVKYVLPGLVSLFVAIISFLISQRYFRHKDEKAKEEDYYSILTAISQEVKHNLDLECQIHAYLYVKILPTFTLLFFSSDNLFK